MSYTLLSKIVRFLNDFHSIDIFSLILLDKKDFSKVIFMQTLFSATESPTYTRYFLSLVTNGWSFNVKSHISKQKTKSYEISYIGLQHLPKFTVRIPFLVMSAAPIIRYQQCIFESIFCLFEVDPFLHLTNYLHHPSMCWRRKFLTTNWFCWNFHHLKKDS